VQFFRFLVVFGVRSSLVEHVKLSSPMSVLLSEDPAKIVAGYFGNYTRSETGK
jgi:hypothetical protein